MVSISTGQASHNEKSQGAATSVEDAVIISTGLNLCGVHCIYIYTMYIYIYEYVYIVHRSIRLFSRRSDKNKIMIFLYLPKGS
jgi:hypothetical protein